MTAALQCRGLDAGYGDKAVVRAFDLQIAPGEVLALIGPNGAGKTTLLLTLAGLIPSLGGRAEVHGERIDGIGPTRINRRGLVLVPDDRSLFTTLTVRENLRLAQRKGGMSEADVLAHFPKLGDRLGLRAGSLSGGEQQMLAIGRALMQRPTVLLIDELSMGLAPILVDQLLPVIRSIADETGTAVVLVEQHVHLALAIANRAVVLVHGSIALQDDARRLAEDPARLEHAYLAG